MTTDGNGARPYLKVSTSVLTGVAQTVRALDCPLGAVTRLSAGGGALPVIMSIIGPRETHDYRNYNLLVRSTNTSKQKTKKTDSVEKNPEGCSSQALGRPYATAGAGEGHSIDLWTYYSGHFSIFTLIRTAAVTARAFALTEPPTAPPARIIATSAVYSPLSPPLQPRVSFLIWPRVEGQDKAK